MTLASVQVSRLGGSNTVTSDTDGSWAASVVAADDRNRAEDSETVSASYDFK